MESRFVRPEVCTRTMRDFDMSLEDNEMHDILSFVHKPVLHCTKDKNEERHEKVDV